VTKSPDSLCKKLGLTFNDPKWFVLALTHRSIGSKNNERLEFLGDSILGFVIAEALVNQFPKASEGELSRLRANLVNQDSLAELAHKHHFGDYLILGSGELKSGGFRRASILSDALEAIMGAIVKDKGDIAAKSWILELFAERLAGLSLDNWQKDPKTRLQEYMQAKQFAIPVYTLINESGLSHEKVFQVDCAIDSYNEKLVGTGISRKKAEQQAAELMLKKIAKDSK
jgi:ribonuclease-3